MDTVCWLVIFLFSGRILYFYNNLASEFSFAAISMEICAILMVQNIIMAKLVWIPLAFKNWEEFNAMDFNIQRTISRRDAQSTPYWKRSDQGVIIINNNGVFVIWLRQCPVNTGLSGRIKPLTFQSYLQHLSWNNTSSASSD